MYINKYLNYDLLPLIREKKYGDVANIIKMNRGNFLLRMLCSEIIFNLCDIVPIVSLTGPQLLAGINVYFDETSTKYFDNSEINCIPDANIYISREKGNTFVINKSYKIHGVTNALMAKIPYFKNTVLYEKNMT